MKKVWERLEFWVKENASASLKLRPPATAAAIVKAEKALGVAFPSDFRASLAIHDGQKSSPISWLPAGAELLSLTEIVSQWKLEKSYGADDPDGLERLSNKRRVRAVAWHPQRVPIAYAEMATAGLYLDLVPGPKGHSGQVIYNHTETDYAVLGESFEHFLTRYVDLLEQKKLAYVADEAGDYEVDGFIVIRGGKPASDFYKALAIA